MSDHTTEPPPDPTAPAKEREAMVERLIADGGHPPYIRARTTPELREMVAELDKIEEGEAAEPSEDLWSYKPADTTEKAVPPEAEAKLGVLAEAIASTPPWHENVKAARKKLGWTQADLGALAGVSGSYISRLERGKTEPSPEEEEAINEALAGKRGEPPSEPPAAQPPPADAAPLGRVELLLWLDDVALWESEKLFDDLTEAKAWLAEHGAEGRRYSFRLEEAISIRVITQRVLEAA